MSESFGGYDRSVAGDGKHLYPAERAVAYVGSLAAVGGAGALFAWAIASYLLPGKTLDLPTWTLWGAGLAGIAGLSWVVSDALF